MVNADNRALIQSIMQEVIDVAVARGHEMPEGYTGKLLAVTEHMPDYWPSMYHDFACGGRWSCRRSMPHRWTQRRRAARWRRPGRFIRR